MRYVNELREASDLDQLEFGGERFAKGQEEEQEKEAMTEQILTQPKTDKLDEYDITR